MYAHMYELHTWLTLFTRECFYNCDKTHIFQLILVFFSYPGLPVSRLKVLYIKGELTLLELS